MLIKPNSASTISVSPEIKCIRICNSFFSCFGESVSSNQSDDSPLTVSSTRCFHLQNSHSLDVLLFRYTFWVQSLETRVWESQEISTFRNTLTRPSGTNNPDAVDVNEFTFFFPSFWCLMLKRSEAADLSLFRLLSCAEKVCGLQPKKCSRVVKTRTWLRWCKRLFASGQTEGGNRCCCTYTQKCRNNKVMICIIYLMNIDWPNRMGGFGHIAHPYWHDWVIVGISRCICVKSWVNVYRYQIGENAFLGTGFVSLTQSCNARKGRCW